MVDFRAEFKRIFKEHGITYEVKGIITADRRIYSIGTDSKVLSTVFELLVKPVVYQIAQHNGLIVREARAQNYYPDFTLMKSEDDDKKIAADVKTTYRREDNQKFGFTLGGYTSFIRNETKNIEFPYSQYVEAGVGLKGDDKLLLKFGQHTVFNTVCNTIRRYDQSLLHCVP